MVLVSDTTLVVLVTVLVREVTVVAGLPPLAAPCPGPDPWGTWYPAIPRGGALALPYAIVSREAAAPDPRADPA